MQPGERLLAEEVACFDGNTLAQLGGEMELLVRAEAKQHSAFRAQSPMSFESCATAMALLAGRQ